MKTSYKFWYVTKQDDIHISEVGVRFYEGEDVIETYETPEGTKTYQGYKPTKRLAKKDVPHIKGKLRKELSGQDCFVYTSADFGVTDDLDVVRAFLNGLLSKDSKREAIVEQKATNVSVVKSQIIK